MIEFLCPHCAGMIRVAPSFAGKRGKCPRCSEKVTVPDLVSKSSGTDLMPPPVKAAASAVARVDAIDVEFIKGKALAPSPPPPPPQAIPRAAEIHVAAPIATAPVIQAVPVEAVNGRPVKDCPFCGEEILAAAVKCKHCGEMLDGAPGAIAPKKVQVVEQTAKRFKAIQLVGVLLLLAALCVGLAGFALPDKYVLVVIVLTGLLLVAGFVTSIVGKSLAWWFHG